MYVRWLLHGAACMLLKRMPGRRTCDCIKDAADRDLACNHLDHLEVLSLLDGWLPFWLNSAREALQRNLSLTIATVHFSLFHTSFGTFVRLFYPCGAK